MGLFKALYHMPSHEHYDVGAPSHSEFIKYAGRLGLECGESNEESTRMQRRRARRSGTCIHNLPDFD